MADSYHWVTDPDPALFFNDIQDVNKKVFFALWYLLYPTVYSVWYIQYSTVQYTVGTVHLHHPSKFKDNKCLRSHKIVEINVLFNFLLVDEKIRTGSRIERKLTDPDPDVGGPKT
jgi:hypothetical protein